MLYYFTQYMYAFCHQHLTTVDFRRRNRANQGQMWLKTPSYQRIFVGKVVLSVFHASPTTFSLAWTWTCLSSTGNFPPFPIVPSKITLKTLGRLFFVVNLGVDSA